jgi:hypothetical protein
MKKTEFLETRLHTDNLERKYGKVTARVFEHTSERRVIDIVDDFGVCRTHALTIFPDQYVEGVEGWDESREEIGDGGLIGKMIRKHGFMIDKNWLVEGVIPVPIWLQERFEVEGELAVMRGYEFLVLNGERQLIDVYGLVFEIDSPDFTNEVFEEKLVVVGNGTVFDENVVGSLLDDYLERDRLFN